MAGALTVEAGREPNRKLAVFYSSFNPGFVVCSQRAKVWIKVNSQVKARRVCMLTI